jgi:signal transduction histidine kinase
MPPEPIWLLADPARLEQVLVNLLTNAAKYTDDGGRIWLTVAEEDEMCVLRVRDTGVGIPAEHLQDIFNPFYTTKAPGQGTGLGLSVVHSILQRYHGEIRVASEVGVGTTFTIELPCQCHAEALGEHEEL